MYVIKRKKVKENLTHGPTAFFTTHHGLGQVAGNAKQQNFTSQAKYKLTKLMTVDST